MKFLSTLSVFAAPIAALHASARSPTNATEPIITTKVTPSYWRATFANPPFNIEDNAWFASFFALVNKITHDPDVKVVVFDSSAPDFFMAHFDIINPVKQEYLDTYWGNITLLANSPVLTIAAVQGIARGGGAELVAALDVQFASKEKAKFGQIEVGFGQLPGGGGMSLLPRLVGRSRALEIILGSEDFDADTAAEYGWINRAIPDAEFEEFVDSYARRVSSFDKVALSEAKRIVNKRSSYPTAEEQKEDWNAFLGTLRQPHVQARTGKAIELGLQKDLDFELNIDQEMMKLVGKGPWNV
ncbi:enoyl-CoA hydratase/carnithine racemase [Massariosphaeria phaeospora]|uniref:Enoyl-CoA hydratase/carnithine racemase n=1 Tax=Massariosphaeria phaeospora TaxID=100035 RepID=A0A7C8M3P2_9PLEO|nr:enoyl-CoA hydratase/carnithine racemase [Massariosphaeria phaeospora]